MATPVHPGEILGDELEETGLTAKRLADLIAVPPNPSIRFLRLDGTLPLTPHCG